MPMVMSKKGNLRMTRPTDTESITVKRVVSVSKVSGSRTRSKVKDWKSNPIMHVIKDSTLMEKSMDWVKKRNLMVRYIEVSSLKITGMEMGFKTFRRARNILASIKTAKGTA